MLLLSEEKSFNLTLFFTLLPINFILSCQLPIWLYFSQHTLGPRLTSNHPPLCSMELLVVQTTSILTSILPRILHSTNNEHITELVVFGHSILLAMHSKCIEAIFSRFWGSSRKWLLENPEKKLFADFNNANLS